MKQIGIVIIVIGILMAFVAINSDTSVAINSYIGSDSPDRVSNLAKMSEQQNLLAGSCALCLIGTILFVGGTIVERLDDLDFPRATRTTQTSKRAQLDLGERELTSAHAELKARYERSEITLEDYAKEWNNLS